MVIIRINTTIHPEDWVKIAEGIHEQALHDGVIVLPHFCELLNEVPADEEIKVIQQDVRAREVEKELPAARRLQESDCHTCASKTTCLYNQRAHAAVRINCPLWRPKK